MAGYAEIGRRPEKLNFLLTCNLLSQYIKEKGLGKPEAYRPPTTMSLLPGVEVLGDEITSIKHPAVSPNAARSMELFSSSTGSTSTANEPKKSQLTIFYAGKVLVFDNFPADKAEDLIQLASKGSNATSSVQNFSFAPPAAAINHPICPSPTNPPDSLLPRVQPKCSDLPIARKASLHRFLEKRKDRISSKTPYQVSEGSKDVWGHRA